MKRLFMVFGIVMLTFIVTISLTCSKAVAQNGTIVIGTVDLHFELVDPALPTVLDVQQLTFLGVEYRNTTDEDVSGSLSAGDSAIINGVFAITSFSCDGTVVIPPGFGTDWEMTGRYIGFNDTVSSVTGGSINYFMQPGSGILTLYVDVLENGAASALTGQGYDDGTIVAQFVVHEGGGVYKIIHPFDGSRDLFMLKQSGSGLDGFFDPDITGGIFDCNLDADSDQNGVGGNVPMPTDWPYPNDGVNFPWSYYVFIDGSLRFGYLQIDEGGKCRMTGGNATVSPAIGTDGLSTWTYNFKKRDTGFWITTGGQIGAPSVEPARGHWTHVQHGGAEGSFTFHSGTTSAPNGTEISTIKCNDPGWCVQARCAPFKQIFWTGVGNFARQGFDAAALGDCVVADMPKKGGTLHYYRAMVGDFGENKRPTREDALVDENPLTCDWFARLQAAGWPGPPGPYDASLAVFLGSTPDAPKPLGFGDKGGQICDKCPDYYQIEIYCTQDPASGVIYTFSGFLESGNYQIHPETGDQCPVVQELVPELCK